MLDFLGTMFGFLFTLIIFGGMLAVAIYGFMKSEEAVKKQASNKHRHARPVDVS